MAFSEVFSGEFEGGGNGNEVHEIPRVAASWGLEHFSSFGRGKFEKEKRRRFFCVMKPCFSILLYAIESDVRARGSGGDCVGSIPLSFRGQTYKRKNLVKHASGPRCHKGTYSITKDYKTVATFSIVI